MASFIDYLLQTFKRYKDEKRIQARTDAHNHI